MSAPRTTSPTSTTVTETAGFVVLAAVAPSLAVLWLWGGLAG
jgi:type IV secretion system protein VirD4